MKIYVYTILERNWWTDSWETNITGVVTEPVTYFHCDEVQVWEDGLLVYSADKGSVVWNKIHEVG